MINIMGVSFTVLLLNTLRISTAIAGPDAWKKWTRLWQCFA